MTIRAAIRCLCTSITRSSLCQARAVALAVSTVAITVSAAVTAADRPSLVLILADDMGTAQLEAMSRVTGTVFASGARFRAYAEVPICAPSRATFLTGKLAHNHGVISNETSGRLIRQHEAATFAVPIQQSGYVTAYYGKYINRYNGSYTPPGWTIWRAFQPCCQLQNQPVIIDGVRTVVPGIADDWMRQQAVDLIWSTPPDTPLLLVLTPMAPHLPHKAAGRHRGTFAGRQVPRDVSFNERKIGDKPALLHLPLLTPAEVQALDASWAASFEQLQTVDELALAVYEALRDSGRLDDTYLIFSSDHGIHFGQHRAPEDKTEPWETDIRIPLLVRGPGVAPAADVAGLIAMADLAPTLLELAGAASEEMDGLSFAPMLRGEAGARTAVPIAMWQPTAPYALDWKGVRTERFTYVKYPTGERMLYNNIKDPFQVNNVVGRPENHTAVETLDALTERLFVCRGSLACRG